MSDFINVRNLVLEPKIVSNFLRFCFHGSRGIYLSFSFIFSIDLAALVTSFTFSYLLFCYLTYSCCYSKKPFFNVSKVYLSRSNNSPVNRILTKMSFFSFVC